MRMLLAVLLLATSCYAQGGMGPGPGTPHTVGSGFTDSFNRSDRALNGDNGWAFAVGSTGFNIVSSELQIGSTVGDNSQVNSGASLANGAVQADIKIGGGSASVGLIYRYQDANNFYLMDFENNGTNVSITFYKREGGSYVALAGPTVTAAWTVGAYATCRVTFSGSNHVALFNGASQITPTDGTFTAAGLTGLRNGGAGTATRTVDNYSASP